MTRRIVTLLDLVDDAALIAAYEAHHAPGAVPADVIADIRARGYKAMEIWRVADRLVMIAEVDDGPAAATDPALQPAVDAWEQAMDAYQRPIVAGPKWAVATKIFDLAQQVPA